MNHIKLSEEIIARVGGVNNIEHIEHCSTRLRLSLLDNQLVDIAALEKLPGVLGVRVNAQCQVIVGKYIVEVYNVIKQLSQGHAQPEKKRKHAKKWGTYCIDFIISIFQPLVPAIAGGGILKSLLILLDLIGWLSKSSSTYKTLDNIASAPIYFLPILVAITTATKLKVNILVAVSAVSVMILPAMGKQLADGAQFISFDLKNVAYASQVFPAIMCVILYSQTERFFNHYSPSVLRTFLSPMLSLLVTVPVTLLFLGPIGYELGSWLAIGILWLYGKLGFVATALLAAALPFMVASGMHKPLLPYAVSSLAQFGREIVYAPASLAHNIAESGTCMAIALKSRNKAMRSTALSAGISALCGITEPALYGVTLLNKKALYGVVAGGTIGGAVMGWMVVEGFALVSPGLPSMSIFISPDNRWNILYAFLGAGLSFIVSFMFTFSLWREENKKGEEKPLPGESYLYSPAEGQVIPLSQVKDDVFSAGIMGSGIAIIPSKGALYAPIDGTISTVFEHGHAASMLTSNGAEIIFHIGIDTIKLNGRGFTSRISVNQKVKAGDLLIEFDLNTLIAAGYDPVVIMVVANSEQFQVSSSAPAHTINNRYNVMTLKESV
ncbi:beta-glucoside-specific PTS transporter subunit IIABC [Serratia entomophila]|uniref:beta-glucoside-specific PTS transporter subunit IIABC n=1 Tax=Serratia entomophila TaxID=42906 RepID=UPI002179FA1A|nr:beta-glucoside-specific PTS transporter subunit IIABC [Serratia entomophila]CAI1006070.1 EIIBCA-Bgl [Serratia entomophila]CAI1554493.1 EIIBCA-Bgl [Serratia entomophila]CAI1655926.1 EIIBCA-Bgl [Serratia entomophila]CAI1712471.1 EIIBCA-Bgl [Serratia entomophila]CAI1797270.1 EIIBCA-Bgl [Serratia entomophila]